MLITIKTLSGRKLSLDFEPTQKVEEIKTALQEKKEYHASKLDLFIQEKSLKMSLLFRKQTLVLEQLL